MKNKEFRIIKMVTIRALSNSNLSDFSKKLLVNILVFFFIVPHFLLSVNQSRAESSSYRDKCEKASMLTLKYLAPDGIFESFPKDIDFDEIRNSCQNWNAVEVYELNKIYQIALLDLITGDLESAYKGMSSYVSIRSNSPSGYYYRSLISYQIFDDLGAALTDINLAIDFGREFNELEPEYYYLRGKISLEIYEGMSEVGNHVLGKQRLIERAKDDFAKYWTSKTSDVSSRFSVLFKNDLEDLKGYLLEIK
jgi:hypothetical protein